MQFWIEGDNNTIIVGDSCTFTHTVHLCAQEYGSSINLGEDCMLSNNIILGLVIHIQYLIATANGLMKQRRFG